MVLSSTTPLQRQITQRMAQAGYTQHTLALAAGVGQTYIRDILSGRSREPRPSKLTLIAEALNCTLPDLLEEENAFRPPSVPEWEVEVRGSVQAGMWRESTEWPISDRFRVALPTEAQWRDRAPYGLLVEGLSMNLIFPPGTIAVVVNFSEARRQPQNGDYVVVARRDPFGDSYEATIKALQLCGDGRVLLWPRSTAPEFQTPLELPPLPSRNSSRTQDALARKQASQDWDQDFFAEETEHDPAGAPDVIVQGLVIGYYSPQPRAEF
ncbi:LexA family transcriptional regulator [Oecophyllibacter saccharovorans]|uniref:Helix-turn-helix domain-containing protein n=1 Tax=Oecophyllibacter saccharovorans TaxID=2558360 RepID=A0A506UKG0_9PROT|nr:LexA family transcriptional regulator [Oecophyllibacter saccharovorans]TPW33819.1 helix-turn-helix domain-containing protein [Oecophyllibacter saccharovorans]